MHDICQAIKNRQVIEFTYDDDRRTAEPHFLGYDKDGDLTLSAWQLHGRSGEGWRQYHVSKLYGLSITRQRFAGPRDGYNPHDARMSEIVCRL